MAAWGADMPINPNIPLQAANIPQIRYQPESQFESFAKIQPTLNAMQQMKQRAVAARGAAEIEDFIRKSGHNINLGQLGTLLVRVGKVEEGTKLLAAYNEQKQLEDALGSMGFGGQAAAPTGANAMVPAPTANAMAQPAAGQPSVPSPAVTAPAMPATAPSMATQGQAAGFRPTPQQLVRLAASGRAGGRVAGVLAPFAKPEPTPSEIAIAQKFGFELTPEGYSAMKGAGRAETQGPEIVQLMRARDALPAGSPDRALVQARIDKLNAPSSGVTIQMPVPVYDPKTGQTTYVAREEAIGKTPASAAPKPVDTTQSEEQAATNTARLLRRSREISAALQRSPAAEAPSALEASMQNIPGLSAATNLVRSTDRQIVASAQDDILDALLYLATGAAYNKEQLQQQKSAYLASWSDSAETRAVKRQRLVDMIRDAKIRAGNAWTPELDYQLNLLLESPTMRRQSAGSAAPAPAPAPARTGGTRREIAPGVFVTERP